MPVGNAMTGRVHRHCRVQQIQPKLVITGTGGVRKAAHKLYTNLVLINVYGLWVSNPSSGRRRTAVKDPDVVRVLVQRSLEACRVRVVLSSERAAMGVSHSIEPLGVEWA